MNEKTIEEAAQRREEAEAALLRPDGSRYYSDEEHAERMAAIRAEHARTFDRLEAGLEERADRARGELEALEHADPAGSLSTEELQRAAALNQFVGAEVETVSTQDLARRCRAAAASGDRASMYALQHHASRRQDEDLTGEVGEAVAQLRHALDPDAERKLASAREALEEADDLRFKAQLGRAGAESIGDLYARGAYWTGAAS
jgi:hypothetical protein